MNKTITKARLERRIWFQNIFVIVVNLGFGFAVFNNDDVAARLGVSATAFAVVNSVAICVFNVGTHFLFKASEVKFAALSQNKKNES